MTYDCDTYYSWNKKIFFGVKNPFFICAWCPHHDSFIKELVHPMKNHLFKQVEKLHACGIWILSLPGSLKRMLQALRDKCVEIVFWEADSGSVNKILVLHGTWRFIDMFTRTCQRTSFWIQYSTPTHPVSVQFHFDIIVPSAFICVSQVVYSVQVFCLILPCMLYAQPISAVVCSL
jgi:hypothetical protein